MRSRVARWSVGLIILFAWSSCAWALNGSVPGIHGDLSRVLLGDGTGVVVGIVDSGVDDTHPALTGRMDAESNFAGGAGPDDVFGHGTWVSSVALGNNATYMGMAPDAHYVNARVLDNGNGFPNDIQVRNGIGYAVDHGVDVMNLSLNYFAPTSYGTTQLDLMIDWAAFDRRISSTITSGNISGGTGTQLVRGPGSAYNGVTVGRTTNDFSRVHTDSAIAFTADGRMKPDVVAPGTNLTLANDDWETQGDWDFGLGGTSFAAPHVAGLMAQQIEAGTTLGLSTDPLVLKSTILNSTEKVLDKSGNPWAPAQQSLVSGVLTSTKPLDTDSGTGQIDGLGLAVQYLSGEQAPGTVEPIGWDQHTIADGQSIDYKIDTNLLGGTTLTTTLTWYRHVGRTDDGDGEVDSGDTFTQLTTLSDLNLQVLRNGSPVAASVSTKDNVEHLSFPIAYSAEYTLRVMGQNVTSLSEEFALAWWGTAVPEPSSMVLALLALAALFRCRRAKY